MTRRRRDTRAVDMISAAFVRPVKGTILKKAIPATDKAWRREIFGLGGSSKRIAGAQIGMVDGQPLAVIAELPSELEDGTPAWAITTDAGTFAFAGNAAVFNDAGWGPASLGISSDRLRAIVQFDMAPDELKAALERTLQSRNRKTVEDAV